MVMYTQENTAVAKLHTVNWDFPDSNKTNGIHAIHPYPARFIAEIPRTLISLLDIPADTAIFDPFCGSGSTLVEAQLAGFAAIGVDLNPIACLISRVKTQPLPEIFLNEAARCVEKARQPYEMAAIPPIPNLDHWFASPVQQEIADLRHAIDQENNLYVREALQLALSSILVRVSNQESDTRYAAIKKKVQPGDVFQQFSTAVQQLWAAKQTYRPLSTECQVIEKNIMLTEPADIARPVGCVITSPPYPNAYEYWLYHKYRMFWLDRDPLAVKVQEIGARAHYFRKNPPTIEDFQAQMKHVLQLLHKVVVPGGYICIVIGRSKIHGQIVDNASLVTAVARQCGLCTVTNLSRQIAASRKSFNLSHANIKTEQILIFQKP